MKKHISCFLVFLIASLPVFSMVSAATLAEQYKSSDTMQKIEYDLLMQNAQYYDEALAAYREKGALDYTGEDIPLALPQDKMIADYEGTGIKAVLLDKDQDMNWTVEVPQDGLYQLAISFYLPKGNGNWVNRDLLVDGQVPYQDALALQFDRLYRDSGAKSKAENGNDIRPQQEEVYKWQNTRLVDSRGFYAEPLRLYLSKGTHKITLRYVSEPMAIASAALVAPKQYLAYKDVKKEYESKGYQPVKEGTYQKIEAELPALKSEQVMRAESNNDPLVSPPAKGDFILNTFGEDGWNRGTQWVEWSVQVKETGLYKMAWKAGQWWSSGRSSYRQLTINGEVPFQEALLCPISYSRSYQMITLGGEDPFLFYFEAGKEYTIRLTHQVGSAGSLVNEMSNTTLDISKIVRDIIKITGSDPDPNYDYELFKTIPSLKAEMQQIADSMKQMMDYMEQCFGKGSNIYYSLKSNRKKLLKYIADPDKIPVNKDIISEMGGTLGIYMQELQNGPISLDYIAFAAPDYQFEKTKPNVFQSFSNTMLTFMKSFIKDYDNVGNQTNQADKMIKVWVGMGREWAEVLRDLTDNEFTPKYGIGVKINTFPAGQLNAGAVNALLLAINSGNAPDVAVGVSANSPVEFAIRDALYGLSSFPNYPKVEKRFSKEAMTPYRYRGEVYALPCAQDFSVLFYRKDILSNLGLGVPQTWTDIYKMLPVLQNNGLNFFYPPTAATISGSTLDAFLYQKGGDFYNADGTACALDTPEAYSAFKEWTELYTNYNLDQAANFYNRFRSGEIPIGIGGYSEYVMLTVAAPELKGRWGIGLFPGTMQEDGTIDHTVSGAANTANIIVKDTKLPQESFDYLDWWMSEETQLEFGRQIEGVIGTGARWNSANLNAFSKLPWTDEESRVIMEQWKHYKLQPVVLGGYATSRYLNFAWNDVVVGKKEIRDSLEETVENINKEIVAKQEEYGIGN